MVSSKWRGHEIEKENDNWIYCDTRKPVRESVDRNCGVCDNPQTIEGHDKCLGTLPYIMNACCGHGEIREAYLQFLNGFYLQGIFAIIFIKILKLLI